MIDEQTYKVIEQAAVIHAAFIDASPDINNDVTNEDKALRVMSVAFLALLTEALESGIVGGKLQEQFDNKDQGVIH